MLIPLSDAPQFQLVARLNLTTQSKIRESLPRLQLGRKGPVQNASFDMKLPQPFFLDNRLPIEDW